MSKHTQTHAPINSFNEAWIQDKSNWKEILTCVESHDILVEALEDVTSCVTYHGLIEAVARCKQALAKIKE